MLFFVWWKQIIVCIFTKTKTTKTKYYDYIKMYKRGKDKERLDV